MAKEHTLSSCLSETLNNGESEPHAGTLAENQHTQAARGLFLYTLSAELSAEITYSVYDHIWEVYPLGQVFG